MKIESLNDTLNNVLKFPLIEAITGRRARRFSESIREGL
jgi:hypothetical protein